jgi:alanyl-tRNA synthetase
VRVVEIGGPFSLELCGGPTSTTPAQIGPITDPRAESSRRLGVRRVEAYVGLGLVPAPGQGARADGRSGVVAEGSLR